LASKGVNLQELYPEGVNAAYALKGDYTNSLIGTAVTTENKTLLDHNGFISAVRETYKDEGAEEEHHQNPHAVIHKKHSRAHSQPAFQNIALLHPTTKRYSQFASPIVSKKVAVPSSPPAEPPTLSRTIYVPSPTHSSSDSRKLGVLKGPVPDMYAFGGETIHSDEELERLEEEERRIDEAIHESERLDQWRVQREPLRGEIEERRARLDSI
jgi:hypothetical protein